MNRKVKIRMLFICLLTVVCKLGNSQIRMLSDLNNAQERANYLKSDEMGHVLESGILNMDSMSLKHLEMLSVSPMWDEEGRDTRNSWYYHMDTSRNALYSKGKITNVVHYQGDVSVNNYYSYDKNGRISNEVITLDDANSGLKEYAIHYQRGFQGKVEQISYPDGTIVFYSYDDKGRLFGIGNHKGSLDIAKYIYDSNGHIKKIYLNNKTIEANREYDLLGHLTNHWYQSNAGDTLYAESFYYKDNQDQYYEGHIKEKTVNRFGLTQAKYTYEYDGRYQLTDVEYSATNNSETIDYKYDYDMNGNINWVAIDSDTTRYQRAQGRNVRLFHGKEADNFGMITKISTPLWDTAVIQYDPLNKMPIAVYDITNPDDKVSFYYDNQGRRVLKVRQFNHNGVTYNDSMKYIYAGHGLPHYRELSGYYIQNNDSVFIHKRQKFVYGKGYAPIAMINEDGSLDYLISDYQGSVIVVYDDKLNINSSFRYKPYGELDHIITQNFEASSDMAEGMMLNKYPYTYTGQEYDEELGIYNFRARFYDPKARNYLEKQPNTNLDSSPYEFVK